MSGCLFFLYRVLRVILLKTCGWGEQQRYSQSEGAAAEKKRANRIQQGRPGREEDLADRERWGWFPSSQLELWLSRSGLGFLWALNIYWVPAMGQAGAGFFSWNLTSSSWQIQEGGSEDSEAHGGKVFVQGHTAREQWGWDWNPRPCDAAASCSSQISCKLKRSGGETDVGPPESWSMWVLTRFSIVSYQFLQYFSR